MAKKELEDLRVLLVEDSTPVLQMVRSILHEIGIGQVVTANNGAKALDILGVDTEGIDLIISDWEMPEVTGLELLRSLRDRGSKIPFLMMKSVASESAVKAAIQAGVNAYIRKPFSQKDLMSKLSHLLRCA